MTIPFLSTYRVQLNSSFTFRDALKIVPYLHDLGISHLYCSPVLTSRPGSTHGYDVVDPCKVDSDLGTEDDWCALANALHQRDMGILLDIVPNHMGTGIHNPYWQDVLRHGRGSRWAHWFDIDWDTPQRGMGNRVFRPVLGDGIDKVIERGELTLVWERDELRVKYYEQSFPVATSGAVDRILEEAGISAVESPPPAAALEKFTEGPEGADRLKQLLALQHYVLSSWRRASQAINYRRFFDVNDLVALRMEDPAVFDETHALIFRWVEERVVDGLRIDHVDGLLDPRGYFERLRESLDTRRPGEALPIFVEKILSPGEHLPSAWPVDGTTGYEFVTSMEPVFINPTGAREIEEEYRRFVRIRGESIDFTRIAYKGKLSILRTALHADCLRLVHQLRPLARADERVAGLSRDQLLEMLIQFIACLPVYRTYADARQVTDEDRHWIEQARVRGREEVGTLDEAFDFMAELLSLEGLEHMEPAARESRLSFVGRFQQMSGPATAKGVEDTALYRYYPLASLNEVGGEPDRQLHDAVSRFHADNSERAEHWSRSMLVGSTHDTKRSADVRSRLDALSDYADDWNAAVRRWHRRLAPHRSRISSGRVAPDPNAEYLFFQSAVGVWPTGAAEAGARRELADRIVEYLRKATREAKAHTSWTDPDPEYEEACERYVRRALEDHWFLQELERLVGTLSTQAVWNTLSRVLLHATAPGSPDIYQGDELWNLSLVDPDNRRAVNYAIRAGALQELTARYNHEHERDTLLDELVGSAGSGRLKLHVLARALHARKRNPELFSRGDYRPLQAVGRGARHLVAFSRTHGSKAAIVVSCRETDALMSDGKHDIRAIDWSGSGLRPLADKPRGQWRCAITGAVAEYAEDGQTLFLAPLLGRIPLALLLRE